MSRSRASDDHRFCRFSRGMFTHLREKAAGNSATEDFCNGHEARRSG